MKYSLRSLDLIALDDAEYDDFARRQIEEYATQHVNAGEWTAGYELVRQFTTDAHLRWRGRRQCVERIDNVMPRRIHFAVELMWMEQNPYQSPKEVDSQPTVKAGLGLGVLLLLSIPAGCICGGITCSAVGLTSYLSPGVVGQEDHGQLLGLVLGFVVVVVVPALGIYLFGRRKEGGKIPE